MTDWRERAVAVGAALLLVGSLVAAGSLVGVTAPFSGAAWETVNQPDRTIESPYGTATVTYDDSGVPHIEAENERALAYAAGYVQARDRLFQMDLIRRRMNGTLSEAFGNQTVESDRFHRQMDFEAAADAQWERLQDSRLGPRLEAYTAGVNRFIDADRLPMEFRLNGYEPREWTPEASLLVGMQVTWGLSGDFNDLQEATLRRNLSAEAAAELYPTELDHDSPIIEGQGDQQRPAIPGAANGSGGTAVGAVYDSLHQYTSGPYIGSNNWVVSGNLTQSGAPVLANDPHLTLSVPPVWYEMRLQTDERNTRGVTFPGVPIVLIGSNEEISWGITNVGADVTDFYTYERRGGEYYHDGEWREVQTETETIEVSGGEDRTVTVNKTVHGPLIEREGQEVAVQWLGFGASDEPLAFDSLGRADDMGDVREALRNFHLPASNVVAAEREQGGETLYVAAGKYPIRRTNGTVVPGNRVFNGSAGEGEWAGFTPYGDVNWTGPGFVEYERIPRVDNPDSLATANQRTLDDPGFYLGRSLDYADPYRAIRIEAQLDERTADGEYGPSDAKAIQANVDSAAAERYVPIALEAQDQLSGDAAEAAASLEDWNNRMVRDSEAALVYARWLEHFRNATFYDEFAAAGMDQSYFPKYWTLQRLPADSSWFDDERTPRVETREDIAARAMEQAVAEIEAEGWETYGDYNRLRLSHPFPLDFLDYPSLPTDGSPFTVNNYRVGDTPAGSSWRMVVTEGSMVGVIPGGNSGNYLSNHYSDQLRTWRAVEYRDLPFSIDGNADITFEEGDG